jgi:hypothetical protein
MGVIRNLDIPLKPSKLRRIILTQKGLIDRRQYAFRLNLVVIGRHTYFFCVTHFER